MDRSSFGQRIFAIQQQDEFERLALELFDYQFQHNEVYGRFVSMLGKKPGFISCIEEIPFLPVEFFRTHRVVSGDFNAETVFESSGTTSENSSKHYVVDFGMYEKSFTAGFRTFFGDSSCINIFALLPSYHQRQHSSLIYMVERLMFNSNRSFGGFYMDNTDELRGELLKALHSGNRVMLIGVTYALLDLVEEAELPLPGAIIIETGGMKGRRKEITREELHTKLMKGFHVDAIGSEYGMTELLSQAWSKGNGIFCCPPWMKVLMRDPEDPFSYVPYGRTGGINIIDLANINSCGFIATQDLGKMRTSGSFEVLGRFDNSDIRGCSLLI